MFFDARKAKLLAAGEHMVIDGCQGLRLTASASRKTWVYRYENSSKQMKQVSIGQWPAIPAQAAVAEWQRLRDQRRAGTDPLPEKKAARRALAAKEDVVQRYPVKSLVADFVVILKQTRQADGATAAENALNSLLSEHPDFAMKEPAEVSRSDAFSVLESRKATPTMASKLRSLLGAAWELAHDSGRLDGSVPNWWRQVQHGRLKSKGKIMGGKHVGRTRRTLTPAEVSALLHWLPNMNERGRDTFVMYLWTGTRGVEILGMRPEHVSLEDGNPWWTVPKSETKNSRYEDAVDLRVPLFGRAREVVERRIKSVGETGLLFESEKGEPYTQHDFSTYIYNLQPYSAKAKARGKGGLVMPVTNWSPHNLRRTARTLLASLGCPNEIGEAIVGHLPAEMVDTYNAYSYDRERRLWLQKLSDHLEQVATE